MLIDTRQSEIAAAAPRGADTLWWRASLLAMLLATQQERNQIARTIGVPADQVASGDVELGSPIVQAALPVAASQAATTTAVPYVLTVSTDNLLPIVRLEASAPDRTGAIRLAQAAVQELQAGASTQDTPMLQGLSIKVANPVQARDVVVSSGHTKMAAVGLVVFGVWWLGVVAARGLIARRRRRSGAGAGGPDAVTA